MIICVNFLKKYASIYNVFIKNNNNTGNLLNLKKLNATIIQWRPLGRPPDYATAIVYVPSPFTDSTNARRWGGAQTLQSLSSPYFRFRYANAGHSKPTPPPPPPPPQRKNKECLRTNLSITKECWRTNLSITKECWRTNLSITKECWRTNPEKKTAKTYSPRKKYLTP